MISYWMLCNHSEWYTTDTRKDFLSLSNQVWWVSHSTWIWRCTVSQKISFMAEMLMLLENMLTTLIINCLYTLVSPFKEFPWNFCSCECKLVINVTSRGPGVVQLTPNSQKTTNSHNLDYSRRRCY